MRITTSLKDFDGGVLDFWCNVSFFHILRKLAGYLNQRTCGESANAIRKISPVCLEDLAAILGVGHPESLLAAANVTYHLGDVAFNGVNL